jgi:hypothetical protein
VTKLFVGRVGECSSVGLLVLDGDNVQYVDLKGVRQKSNDFNDFLAKRGKI